MDGSGVGERVSWMDCEMGTALTGWGRLGRRRNLPSLSEHMMMSCDRNVAPRWICRTTWLPWFVVFANEVCTFVKSLQHS